MGRNQIRVNKLNGVPLASGDQSGCSDSGRRPCRHPCYFGKCDPEESAEAWRGRGDGGMGRGFPVSPPGRTPPTPVPGKADFADVKAERGGDDPQTREGAGQRPERCFMALPRLTKHSVPSLLEFWGRKVPKRDLYQVTGSQAGDFGRAWCSRACAASLPAARPRPADLTLLVPSSVQPDLLCVRCWGGRGGRAGTSETQTCSRPRHMEASSWQARISPARGHPFSPCPCSPLRGQARAGAPLAPKGGVGTAHPPRVKHTLLFASRG